MPITSIPANDRRERYIASAGQTLFPYDFPIYAPTDLRVTRLRGTAETVLAYGADYAVSGADEQAGGNVTLTAGAQDGDVIVIESAMPVQRQAQFTNGGALPAAGLEAEFNRTLIALQQFANLLSLTLRVPPTDPSVPSLPPVAARANRLLACDAAGNLIPAAGATGVPVTPFAETLLDDATQDAALTTLGATTVGRNVFRAATQALARAAVGITTTGDAVTTANDADAARAAINAPAAPVDVPGPGHWVSINPGVGNAVVLPAGGTWAWWFLTMVSPGGTSNLAQPITRGVSAGGTTVQAGAANIYYIGVAWRRA